MKKLKLIGMSLVTASLFLAAENASAFSLYQNTLFQDIDRERLSLDSNGNGNLDTGDRLSGVLTIDEISDIFGTSSQALGFNQSEELTAKFEAEVATKTLNVDGTFDYTFKAIAGGVNGLGAGAALAFYTQTPPDLDVAGCTSVAQCEAAATNGSLWMTAGFSDADDQWFASNVLTDDLSLFLASSAGQDLGTFSVALSILNNQTGSTFNQQALGLGCLAGYDCTNGDGLVDIIGNGQLAGGQGLSNGYEARSNFRFTMEQSQVPEPSSLVLIGLGLLGFSVANKKKTV